MTLVDTNVWIAHFQKANEELVELLNNWQVCIHPFVLGELSLGGIPNRTETLHLFRRLTVCKIATNAEVHHIIESHRLYGRGIGWVDANLLASTLISNCRLWTRDRSLDALAHDFDKSHTRPAATLQSASLA